MCAYMCLFVIAEGDLSQHCSNLNKSKYLYSSFPVLFKF